MKWKSLQSSYRHYKRKYEASLGTGSATDDVSYPAWFAYDAMSFLSASYQPGPTIDSLKSSTSPPKPQPGLSTRPPTQQPGPSTRPPKPQPGLCTRPPTQQPGPSTRPPTPHIGPSTRPPSVA
uniref:MADF domain-containing protein n=1 Tax=Anopheles atroparvus TaxID=41427 RepID=A0AAG5D3P0_ANOAO